MQPKYGRKVKLWYMETDSFVYEIEKEGFYWDIAKDVETVVGNKFTWYNHLTHPKFLPKKF